MRRHLSAVLVGAIAPLLAAPASAQTTTVAPGEAIVANVAYCNDETEANNVLRAHRMSGFAAGVDYVVHSPVCQVAVRGFTVLRQVAEYTSLPLARADDRRTFYVIEAVDPQGTRLYIVSMVKVAQPSAQAMGF